MSKREKKMLFLTVGLHSSADQVIFDTVEICTIDVIIKQKSLLTCPLSKSLAFRGVRELSPGRFPENGREGYGWY